MKIIRSVSNDGNINTHLKSFLTQIKDETNIYYFTEHCERHPLAIYNLSEVRFFDSYANLIQLLKKQDDKISSGELFIRTKELTDSFISSIDDFYTICKCFYSPNASNSKNRFADGWLNSIEDKLVKDFKNAITFTELFRIINNCIKHNCGRISQVIAKSTIWGYTLGFFIEGVDTAGSIIPHKDIHSRYNGMYTAISYNWFLLEILAQYYYFAYQATRTLQKIILKNYNLDIKTKSVNDDSDRIINIINSLEKTLSKFIFENEIDKCSQISYCDDTLLIKTPADKAFLKRFQQNTSYNIQLLISCDGISQTYAIPYF